MTVSRASTEVKRLPDSPRKPPAVKRRRNTKEAQCYGITNIPISAVSMTEGVHHKQELIVGTTTDTCSTARRVLRLAVPDGYDFSMAICSYGFFCMMPNKWIPTRIPTTSSTNVAESTIGAELKAHGTLRRPMRYGEQARRCCIAEITCQEPSCLQITLEGELPSSDTEEADIVGQISRMCRLDVSAFRGYSIEQFWRLHPAAKARGFGYLFRSPTVWEDMVKTITICNVRWKQSLAMNRLLCNVASSVPGSFPSPWDIARYPPEKLQQLCSLGYRAERAGGFDNQWHSEY